MQKGTFSTVSPRFTASNSITLGVDGDALGLVLALVLAPELAPEPLVEGVLGAFEPEEETGFGEGF